DNVDGLDKGDKGRATKGAAAGLLGKAYLYRKDYTNAKAEFDKFFTGELKNVYLLMPDYRDNFKDINENNSESLFEIQFTPGIGTDMNWAGDPVASWKQVQTISITYGQEGAGFSDYLPTRWIYDEYKKEKTVDGKSDPRLLVTIASYEPDDNSVMAYGKPWWNPTTSIYPRKYTNDGVGNGKPDEFSPFGESGINYRVLRYADILLMYAEVLNETGNTSGAYSYIQQVRTRANLPDLATVKPNMTQEQMRDQLAHERALEFAIEGQRINDLIRWGWFYNPAKLAELKSHDVDFNTWTAGNEYLPIPQQELDVNKNLLPNPAN
ncbi:MAG: RagB/SusD family nutrient uptake outer membrane protein, partial [Panacibacter sp.]